MSEVKGFAGSVLSGATRTLKITHGSGADGPNEALAVEYPHLVEIYTKAGPNPNPNPNPNPDPNPNPNPNPDPDQASGVRASASPMSA